MAIAFVNKSEAQSQLAVASLDAPALALVAGNFSLAVLRVDGVALSGITITDTAGNTYQNGGYVSSGSSGRLYFFFAANCLGNASNVVHAAFGSSDFCHLTAAQFSGMPTTVASDFTALDQGAGGTTISVTPSSDYADQLAIASSDLTSSGHSTITPAAFTLLGSGTYGPGVGSDDCWYAINSTGDFDGSVPCVCTFTGGFATSAKSMLVAIFRRSPVTSTTPNPHIDSSTPCCHDTGGGTVAGPVLPFVDPAWTAVCTGGGDLYGTTSDPTDPESWDDPTERTADTWLELHITKYPATDGTLTLRYAREPFADSASYKEGRLDSLSKSRRAATDPDGNYDIGHVSAVIADGDGYIRGLLDKGENTEYFANREAVIYTATETARKAGSKRVRFRGWISNVTLLRNRQVRIDITDVVGSQFSGFNLDKEIGVPITSAEHPNAPPETLKLIYPILGGERSDLGAVDENGANVEKGLEPAIDCGDYDITGAETTPTLADPPVITGSGVVGTSGEKTYYYAASLITPYGETGLSNVVSVNGAVTRNLSNYNWIEGTYDNGGSSPFNTVRIWRGDSADPTTFHQWLDEANYTLPGPGTFGYADGAAPVTGASGSGVTRDELDVPKEMTPPTGGAANTNTNIFAWMLISIGYGYDILDIYASDLADGTEPKRVRMDSSVYGTEIITPDDAEWPHADPWREFGGVRQFGFYMRGARLNHHRDGTVTVAVNVCGPHDDSDLLVNQCGTLQTWFLNEHVVKNTGTGYRSGDWGPLETYANGDTIINKNAFDAAQTVTEGWIGSLGYLQDISIHEPITLREILRRWTLSFGWRYASDHWGRIRPVVIDDTVLSTTGRHLRNDIEIVRNDDDLLAWDEVVNRIEFQYHLDADAGDTYRATGLFLENGISIAAHTPGAADGDTDRRVVKQQTRDLWGMNDPATAFDSQQRELTRRRRHPRYVKDVVDLMALDYEIGDRFRRTHYEGLGVNGDVATPMIALAYEEDYDRNEVTIEMQDLRGILADTNDDPEIVYSDPVGADVILSDDTGEVIYADTV